MISASSSPDVAPASPERAKQRECLLIELIPSEMQLSIITHLRAVDLSSLQRTCWHFNDRSMINSAIEHIAEFVYPPELTNGFDTPIVGGEVNAETIGHGNLTYEALRNMEMLVTVRVLSRPEPSLHNRETGFYVSKNWCKAALNWLEVQQEERVKESQRRIAEAELLKRNPHASKKKRSKKLSKKEQRLRSRKRSDALPPWPNVNDDIACPHNELARCSSKSARARRRILDKQAWRVLKKLYPDSVQLSSVHNECLQCAMEAETAKRNESDKREKEKEERKKPLSCPVVRGIYTRSRGVPQNCLVANSPTRVPVEGENGDAKVGAVVTPQKVTSQPAGCPLLPGVYNALPRSWCHCWRKYLKTGDGDRPLPPDASALLCDAHRLPLVPPHLESFLYGETNALLMCSGSANSEDGPYRPFAVGSQNAETITSSFSPVPVGYNPVNSVTDTDASAVALRAAGLSELELQSQRLAMLHLERQQHQEAQEVVAPSQSPTRGLRRNSSQENLLSSPDVTRESINEQLDRENYLVVEILTDEEFASLEKWWPEIHSSYALRFAVTKDTSTSLGANIVWSTPPCRECDSSGKNCKEFVGRLQRARRIRRHGHVANGKGR